MERSRPERTGGRVQGGKTAIGGASNQIFTAGTGLWWYQEAERGSTSSRPLIRLLAAWRLEAGIGPVRQNGSFPDPKDK